MMILGRMLAGGLAAILLLTVLVAVVLPMVGTVLGVLDLVGKLALAASAGLVVLAVLRRRSLTPHRRA